MKKSVLAIALAFGVTSAYAQDLTSKKGEPILPEAGDWGISVDGTSFLNYAGNFFGKTSNNTAPTFDWLNSGNNMIMGRYFKDEKTAYRVGLNIGYHSASKTNLVSQDNFTGTGQVPQVTDKTSVKTTAFGLSAGLEKRKGKTRLQGYYGGEVGFWLGSTKQTNTYGNAYGTSGSAGTSTTPNSTTWAQGSATVIGSGPAVGGRQTAYKSGSTFQFGVRGFIGAEYFLLPKMSLGGEFGWGIGMKSVGAGSTSTENIFTGTSPSVQTTPTGKSFNLDLGTDNNNSFFGPSGSLRLNMYF